MVTYVTMSRTCWTCSKKSSYRTASKMHFMLLLTKTLRKISRVGAGAAELHNWSSAALHSWLNQIELWESSIFMLQCHNLVWLLLLMFYYYCRSWSFSWLCALFLWCYHRLSINIRRDIILSKSLQPKSHPKSESRPICKHKSIAQVKKQTLPST